MAIEPLLRLAVIKSAVSDDQAGTGVYGLLVERIDMQDIECAAVSVIFITVTAVKGAAIYGDNQGIAFDGAA